MGNAGSEPDSRRDEGDGAVKSVGDLIRFSSTPLGPPDVPAIEPDPRGRSTPRAAVYAPSD